MKNIVFLCHLTKSLLHISIQKTGQQRIGDVVPVDEAEVKQRALCVLNGWQVRILLVVL